MGNYLTRWATDFVFQSIQAFFETKTPCRPILGGNHTIHIVVFAQAPSANVIGGNLHGLATF